MALNNSEKGLVIGSKDMALDEGLVLTSKTPDRITVKRFMNIMMADSVWKQRCKGNPRNLFPITIILKCGCRHRIQKPLMFPTESVTCIHGNYLVKFVEPQ